MQTSQIILQYQLLWTGTKPNGKPGQRYIMSTHDSLLSAQNEKEKIDLIHSEHSESYKKAFGWGYIKIIPITK